MRNITILLSILSVMAFADFTRNDQIVTDSSTALEWQDNADVADITKKKTWTAAIDYCEALDFGGHTDWRLPNFNELYYIADRSKINPAIDTTFQTVILSDVYWSSSTQVNNTSNAWVVKFNRGDDYRFLKTGVFFVRCVRAGE